MAITNDIKLKIKELETLKDKAIKNKEEVEDNGYDPDYYLGQINGYQKGINILNELYDSYR